MLRLVMLLVCIWTMPWSVLVAQQNPDGRLPLASVAEPLPLLVRDPYVQLTLKINKSQRQQIRQLTDELDGDLWTARNRPPDQAQPIMAKVTNRLESQMAQILDAKQRRRLAQIRIWIKGIGAMSDPSVARQLELSDGQSKQIQTITKTAHDEISKLQEQAQAGGDLAPLQKKLEELNAKMQDDLSSLLNDKQKSLWRTLAGESLDAKKLGYVDFSAPHLPALDQWINSPPLSHEALEGKVVALHFFAFGCINCIHNYPSYRRWQDKFAGQPFVMLGVHTPETEEERSFEQLQTRVRAEKLTFPIVMDSQSKLWNAWGNSMWPSVYLIDKRGRVRYWWLGELNWQGADGERTLGQRIEELLAEGTDS